MSSKVRNLTNKLAAQFSPCRDKDAGILGRNAGVFCFHWHFWDTVMWWCSYLKNDITQSTWIQFGLGFSFFFFCLSRAPNWLYYNCGKSHASFLCYSLFKGPGVHRRKCIRWIPKNVFSVVKCTQGGPVLFKSCSSFLIFCLFVLELISGVVLINNKRMYCSREQRLLAANNAISALAFDDP